MFEILQKIVRYSLLIIGNVGTLLTPIEAICGICKEKGKTRKRKAIIFAIILLMGIGMTWVTSVNTEDVVMVGVETNETADLETAKMEPDHNIFVIIVSVIILVIALMIWNYLWINDCEKVGIGVTTTLDNKGNTVRKSKKNAKERSYYERK